MGASIAVPAEAPPEEMEKKRLELESALNRLTAEADEDVRRER
jgi:hypothetical protein